MLILDKWRFRTFVARAAAARELGRFEAAAILYAEAARLAPHHAGVHVQCGHMYKEAGQFGTAEDYYCAAEQLIPNDPDLALQFGHLHKRADRLGEARVAYQRALMLRPGWLDPQRELDFIAEQPGFGIPLPPDSGDALAGPRDAFHGRTAAALESLAPSLVARPHEVRSDYEHGLRLRRIGRRETTFWGDRTVLRGVEALLGYVIADEAVVAVDVVLDGIRIDRARLRGGYKLRTAAEEPRRKYVFNIWIDLSQVVSGLHRLSLHFFGATRRLEVHEEEVVIGAPVPEAAYPDSNLLVSTSPEDERPLEQQIRARSSMVRPARGPLFPDGIRNVLVLRMDQLGDMVASVAAIQRLRELTPGARIVGLLTPANAEVAETLDLFDELISVDFLDDPVERRRLMPLDVQEALRERLVPYAFDIAVDLAHARESRELLRLAGAKFTYGFTGGDWPWLSSDLMFHTRDRWNRHDFTPHSTKVLALVESLGTLLRTSAPIIRRTDIARDLLAAYGIGASDRFAILHCGARLAIKRWNGFGELAKMLLRDTELKLVVISEDILERSGLAPETLANDRVITLERKLPFDHFDAFLSYATVMVGNDSGPKHLAALRGTNVVSIFGARVNWMEWGQENVGSVISRKLPCAGCAVLHDPEDCGRDFICITDIKPQEVYDAMRPYIDQPEVVTA